jgi:hypothetical protein
MRIPWEIERRRCCRSLRLEDLLLRGLLGADGRAEKEADAAAVCGSAAACGQVRAGMPSAAGRNGVGKSTFEYGMCAIWYQP